MKIPSRTIAISAGWLLTIGVGFLIGRQTNPPGEKTAASAAVGSRSPSRIHGARGSGDRVTHPARPGALATKSSRRADGRTLDELGDSLRDSDRLARTRRILDLAESLSPDDFLEVVEAFRADGLASLRGTEYSLLLNAWVKADPYAAAEYVESNDESAGSRRTVIAAWAAIDPLGAAAWIADREEEGNTNDWMVGLVSGVASNDPLQALKYLEGIEPGATRAKSIAAVIPQVLQHGLDYATEWVAGIGSEELQRGSARALARELARLDADQAGAWISTMESGPARREAAAIVSDQWAREDLESARQWVDGLPEETRNEAAEGIARYMAKQDPDGTAAWLGSLGSSPDLDAARRTFIQESTKKAPQVALEAVHTLSSVSEQEKVYHRVLKEWSEKNSKDVRTWVTYNAEALPPGIVIRYLPKPKKEPKPKPKPKPNKQGKKQPKN